MSRKSFVIGTTDPSPALLEWRLPVVRDTKHWLTSFSLNIAGEGTGGQNLSWDAGLDTTIEIGKGLVIEILPESDGGAFRIHVRGSS